MSAINLAAPVPTDARVRITYRLTTTSLGLAIFGGGLAGDPLQNTVDNLNDAWAGNPQAVLYANAPYPSAGGGLLATDYFTSLDIKTAHSLPAGLTWGDWIAPYRDDSGVARGGFLSVSVPFELDTIELLQAGTPAAQPAARGATQQSAADASKASAPTLGGVLSTYGSAVVFALVVIVGIVLLARARGTRTLA